MQDFDGVVVFSETKHMDRKVLGGQVTAWRQSNPEVEIVDKIVTQSSDQSFHCVTITIFYKNSKKK